MHTQRLGLGVSAAGLLSFALLLARPPSAGAYPPCPWRSSAPNGAVPHAESKWHLAIAAPARPLGLLKLTG